jgi:hypothetical protein
MSDDRHVVLAFSLGSKAEEAAVLLDALRDIAAQTACGLPQPGGNEAGFDFGSDFVSRLQSGSVPESQTQPAAESRTLPQDSSYDNQKEAENVPPGEYSTWNNFSAPLISAPVSFSTKPVAVGDTESVTLEASTGRMAAEMVIPYPPGIPLLYPGEIITESICGRLGSLRSGGAKFQACADPALQHIKVYNIQKGGEV